MCSTLSLFSLFLLLLQSLSLLTLIHAIIVDVPFGKVKCLTEELRNGTLSCAQYRVVNASASHLTISSRVSDPNGATLHESDSDPNGATLHESDSVESGHFSFEIKTTGRHTACCWPPHFELTASLSVDVEWSVGIRTRGPRDSKKDGNLEAMGKELKKLEDVIKLILDEMIFLQDRRNRFNFLDFLSF